MLRRTGMLLVLTGWLMCGCASTQTKATTRNGEAVLEMVGDQLLRYADARLEVVVDYRFASSSLGESWLILNLGIKGLQSQNVSIARDGVWMRAPDGKGIPLPTQESFLAWYPTAQNLIRRARVASRPLHYSKSNRRVCQLNFLALPGEGPTREVVHTNSFTMCTGLLLFPVDNGVQPGRWRLILDIGESPVRIPIPIGVEP